MSEHDPNFHNDLMRNLETSFCDVIVPLIIVWIEIVHKGRNLWRYTQSQSITSKRKQETPIKTFNN